MLIVERKKGVLLLTLARPEKRNALHPELIGKLGDALAEAEGGDGIRVVVLTGAGQAFCAGLDLGHLMGLDASGRNAYMLSAFALFRQLYELRQPVLAAVNGPAVAGGFDLAAFCDLRFCCPEARFSQAEIRLGLTQIMFPIYKVIGLGRAKELAFTGDVISAEEAHRIGLVNRILPRKELVAETLSFAASLASRPPEALFDTKRLSREVIDMDTKAAMARMHDVISSRLQSEEFQLALRSYLDNLRHRRP